MQRYPRAARKIIWSSNASEESGQPWEETTGCPLPFYFATSFRIDSASIINLQNEKEVYGAAYDPEP